MLKYTAVARKEGEAFMSSFSAKLNKKDLAVMYLRQGFGTEKIMRSIGGYRGEANICILDKINVGGYMLKNVVVLIVP